MTLPAFAPAKTTESLRHGQGTGWPYSSVVWNAAHLFMVESGVKFVRTEPLEGYPGWPDYKPVFDRPIDIGTGIDDMFALPANHPEDLAIRLASSEGIHDLMYTNELVPNP